MNPNLDWALIAVVVVVGAFVVGLMIYQTIEQIRHFEPAVFVERFGYLAGDPPDVRCSVCNTSCLCVGHFTRNDEPWTEWHCPRCVRR